MIQHKLIDLQHPNPITLGLMLAEHPVQPFRLFIWDPVKKDLLHFRDAQSKQVMINVPKHRGKLLLQLQNAPRIDSTLHGPLKPPVITYRPNLEKMVERKYPFQAIRKEVVPALPYGSPARFLYNKGIIQLDANRFFSLPEFVRAFVFKHEQGHYFYTDEEETDRWALHDYLNSGYNFSGAYNALKHYLSDSRINRQRVKSIYNEIAKLNNLPLV